jgi:hypothetical protein
MIVGVLARVAPVVLTALDVREGARACLMSSSLVPTAKPVAMTVVGWLTREAPLIESIRFGRRPLPFVVDWK